MASTDQSGRGTAVLHAFEELEHELVEGRRLAERHCVERPLTGAL